MNLTLWVLLLGGAGAAFFFGRRVVHKSRRDAEVAAVRRTAAREQAARDREDCRALEDSLRQGPYAAATESAPRTDKTPAGRA